MKPTQRQLKQQLDYDPLTGAFTWKVSNSNRIKVGQIAGSIGNHGYLRISIDKKFYLSHRLAWLWMTGEFPPDQIDHINRVKTDNRWENLRAATNQQNQMNCISKDNTSGKKGVTWDKWKSKWKAQIRVNGVNHNLGFYNDIEDAAVAYKNIARILHGEFNHFGEPPKSKTGSAATLPVQPNNPTKGVQQMDLSTTYPQGHSNDHA